MRHSYKQLQRFREERKGLVRQYVGAHYSADGATERVPVNLLQLYVNVVLRNLVANNPRVLLSTFLREHKPTVTAMQAWANKQIEKIGLGVILKRIALDALIGAGIAKVALAAPADSAAAGWGLAAGEPFIAGIDLDDFVMDMAAKCPEEAAFMGHKYRVPLDVVQDSKLYSAARKDLVASRLRLHNPGGDERTGAMARGGEVQDQDYQDMVDLWEVYLPREKLVLTLASTDDGRPDTEAEPLRTQKWLGPDDGPYHILSYGVVPGNPMPLGPLLNLIDIHEITNHLFRKLVRQAERQKEVLAVQGQAIDDAQRVQQASDGDIVTAQNPEGMKPLTFGEPNAKNYAMAEALRNLFSYMAGNLDMMGGLSPQSKTLGQDRLLAENASKSIAEMQDSTIGYVSRVIKALCWYWHNDPVKVMRATHQLPAMPEFQFTRTVSPEQRQQVRFEDLEIRCDPYSLHPKSPQEKAQSLTEIVKGFVIPMMPLLVQQGVSMDMPRFLAKIGEYLDQNDLAEILTIGDPMAVPGQGQRTGGMPQSTERTYNRTNTPGRTPQGDSQNRINALMNVDTGGEQGEPSGAA
jgi:hypothetical protein